MSAKEFYNKKALKHQLQRAINQDYKYFKDCIIEIMEQYAEQQINLSLANVTNCTCKPHKAVTYFENNKVKWKCSICQKPC